MKTFPVLVLLIFCISLSSAKFHAAIYERTYYADEVVFTRTNVTFGNVGELKTKWGTLLADNVSWYFTKEFMNYLGKGGDGSRLWLVKVDDEIIELPAYSPVKYKYEDALSYPSRIEQYINQRQMAEICRAEKNTLKLFYQDARNTVQTLIWNMHSEYPNIHVVNTTYGWAFMKP